MTDERKRILTLVENGTISAEEAIGLLEKLGQGKKSAEEVQVAPQSLKAEQPQEQPEVKIEQSEEKAEQTTSSSTEEDPHTNKRSTTGFEDLFGKAFGSKDANNKVEEIVNELKKDLTEFGSKMSGLLNSTLSKVKGFEGDVPFGERIEFKNNYAFNADEVKGFDIDLPNGKIEVVKTTEPLVTIDVTVKTAKQETEEQTKEQFLEGFIELQEGKLIIKTPSKFSQEQLKIGVPEKVFDIFFVKSLNSNLVMEDVLAKVLKVNLINGPVQLKRVTFAHADIKTKNGGVETRFVKGDDLEVETVNGRIYIEGDLKEVEAESVNGHVVVTTTSESAHKVKASTIAGAVELYVPKTVGLDGKLSTNLGKIDLGITDVSDQSTEDAMLQKVTYFDKVVEQGTVLKLVAESRTGTVLVRYNP